MAELETEGFKWPFEEGCYLMKVTQRKITDRGLASIVVFLGIVYLNTVAIILFAVFFLGEMELDFLGSVIYSIVILVGVGHIWWGTSRLLANRAKEGL